MLKVNIFLLLYVGLNITCYGQAGPVDNSGRSVDHPYINWVSQYPAHKEGEVKHSSAKRIYDFLVQKNKEIALSRPVAVVGQNPGSYWVLDQGDETILQVQKNKKIVDKEERKFEKDLEHNPNSAIPYLDHANALSVINSECNRAGSFFQLALKKDSANAVIYKDYGRYLCDRQHAYADAKKMLEMGMSYGPDELTIKYLGIVNKYIGLQDADSKLKDFGTTTFRELNPNGNYSITSKFDSLRKLTDEAANKFSYETLLARFFADDKALSPEDMYMLIVGYSKQKYYNPFRYNDISEMRMIASVNIDSGIKRGEELIKTNPVNPTLNRELMYYYNKKNDPTQADKYLNRIRQFFNGVLYSGNGSCEKPYVALWAKEEYNFISYLGYKSTENHSMGTCAGQMAEIINVLNPTTQKTEPIHFNVTLIYMQTVGK